MKGASPAVPRDRMLHFITFILSVSSFSMMMQWRRYSCHAFSVVPSTPHFSIKTTTLQRRTGTWTHDLEWRFPQRQRRSLFATGTDDDNTPPNFDENDDGNRKVFDQTIDITQEFDAEALEEMEQEQPSEWMVMKQLLGINIFTFLLAGLIVFFLSMNVILGPGWLGSTIGIQGTGNFEEVSPSLPGALDLNKPEFRL